MDESVQDIKSTESNSTRSDTISMASKMEHSHSLSQTSKIEQQLIVESPTGVKNVIKFHFKSDWKVKDLLHFCCKRLKLKPDDHYLVFDFKELDETEDVTKINFKHDSAVKVFFKSGHMKKGVRVSLAINDVRVSSLFKEKDNLWYIVNVLLAQESIHKNLIPVIIYKKDEIAGEKFIRRVRLRDIGVTSGTCSLKFFQLTQEDLDNRHGEKLEEAVSQTTLQSLDVMVTTGVTDLGMKYVHFAGDDKITPGDEYLDDRRTVAFMMEPVSLQENDIEDYLLYEYFDYTRPEITTFKEALEIQLKSMDKYEVCAALKKSLDKERNIRKADSVETIIRIAFPDGAALQALFNVGETVDDVKNLIAKYTVYLENEFDLSLEQPPKGKRLPVGSNFWEVNCVPCALMYLIPRDEHHDLLSTFVTDMSVLPTQTLANETALLLRGDSLDTFFSSVDYSRLRSLTGKKSGGKKSSLGPISSMFRKSHTGTGQLSASHKMIRESRSSWEFRKTTLRQEDRTDDDADDYDDDMGTVDYRNSRFRKQRKKSSMMGSIDVEPGPQSSKSAARKSVAYQPGRDGTAH